ncbi:MAG: protein-L-isoaspartate(D-aspartate) O-methyltransferase [Sterolibacterium sp.]
MLSTVARMIDQIQFETRDSRDWTGISAIEPKVVEALQLTPRVAFVPDECAHLAYANQPLPVGFGQTISQPFIVALMTQLLLPQENDTILEIGTGSGYQAAVLARLVRRVITVEIVAALAVRAAKTLAALGVSNVEVHAGDGYGGWPESAPYDGIIVTACAKAIPQPLLDQLKPGGRMVIPIGTAYGSQDLRLVEKSAGGAVSSREVLPVAFVPFTRSSV